MNKNTRLKIGLIVDSDFVSKYVYELAQWGQLQESLLISHLIIQNVKHIKQGKIEKAVISLKKNGFLHLARQISFALISNIESLLLARFDKFKDHLKTFNLEKVISQRTIINPMISESGFVYRYSAEDIQLVEDLNLDLLIRCGSGILRGEILTSSRLGIISFHHADNRINRGGPPGFWEVYYKQDNTGFIIQQLTEELDGGNVLIRGSLQTKFFYLLNQASLYTKSNHYLKKLLNDIAILGTLPAAMDSQPYFNPLFRRSNLSEQLFYTLNIVANITTKVVNKFLLNKNYRWGVAYSKSDWKTLVMWRANKIKNPPNHFLADPFVINEGDRDYCFVEDYNYSNSKGCISVYEIKDKGAERIGEAIVEPFHMSFPYLFRFDSKIYMCPETYENREIRIYECINFPLEWKLCKISMENVSAVDTMIFERDGLWWLFTNIDPVDIDDHCSELFIFYSDNPLSENWHPHAKNPILIDSSKARNAGILYDDKVVYRVSQKQGFDMYGMGFSINKILKLNKNEYIETELCSVEPNFFSNLMGCHHLHSNGNITVFDFVEKARVNY